MLQKIRDILLSQAFMVIVVTALLAQFVGRYWAQNLVIGNSFYLSWVLLRIVLPICIIFLVGIPFSRLGLGLPKLDKKTRSLGIIIFAVIIIAFIGVYFSGSYFNYYAGSFFSSGYGKLDRLFSFLIFTSSTLIGWEFIHRGFLCMGIFYLLTERDNLDYSVAIKIAIAVPWIFEVLFHFKKPPLEAFGLLAGSPILSYMAIRTRSILLPFLIHLLVEILFIVCLVVR